MIKAAISTVLMISVSAWAIVDMRNANYSDTWIDLELPGSGYSLKIQRTYNSRTLFNGMFGFGMCSDIETSLELTAEGTIKLTECGAGLEVVYLPPSLSGRELNLAVDEIIKVYRSKNPKQSVAAVNKLRSQLLGDSSLRSKYANEFGIQGQAKAKLFLANGRGPDLIEIKDDQYLRKLPGGETERFDKNGRLIQKNDRNGNFLKFTYSGEQLRDITDNNGRRLSFSYFSNKKVKGISGPNGLSAEYKYANQVDLAEVKNGWGNTYKYQYDELHNMTLIEFPDKTNKKLAYDTNKDWVISFKDRDNCTETYKYEASKKDPQNHYWSNVTKQCEGKTVATAKYEFWYKTNKIKGDYYLHRVLMKTNGQTNDVTYHPVLGRPLTVTRNGQTIKYDYDAKTGLMKSRQEGKKLVRFEYHQACQKVSKVTEGKQWTSFQYDDKCNLTNARNSRGQTVAMRYDKEGRIIAMMDQAKREVKISYEDRFGKPKLVERPGIGSLQVTYKSNGELDKVDSPDGPTTATQVAAAFNNLLEIVEPAGIELGL